MDNGFEFYEHNYDESFNIAAVSNTNLAPKVDDTVYYCGSKDIGVGYVKSETKLYTYGLLSCVGWVLYNDVAAYFTHILVLDPTKIKADGTIKQQVEALRETFTNKVGKAPTNVLIHVDEEQSGYFEKTGIWKKGWMQELVPNSCADEWTRGASQVEHWVNPNADRDRTQWEGAAIKVPGVE